MDIPKHYKAKPTEIRNFSDAVKRVHKVKPKDYTTFDNTNNRRIRFVLPRKSLLRGVRSYLRADVTVAGGNVNSLYECFNRMIINVGNQEIMNEREFGFWNITKLLAHCQTGHLNSASIKNTGHGNTASDGVKNTRIMPLSNPIWDKRNIFSELIPLFKCDPIEIIFEINSSLDQYTSGDATSITIDNVELVCDLVDSKRLRAEYGNTVKRAVETQDHQQRTITASSSTVSEILPAKYQNIKSVLFIQRDKADVSVGTTGAEYFNNILKQNSIDNIEIDLDGTVYPQRPLRNYQNIAESTKALEECWGLWSLGSYHNYEDVNSGRQYGGVPLSVERKVISGIRSANSSGDLQFRATINNTNDTYMDFFIMYDKILEIDASGAMRIVK